MQIPRDNNREVARKVAVCVHVGNRVEWITLKKQLNVALIPLSIPERRENI